MGSPLLAAWLASGWILVGCATSGSGDDQPKTALEAAATIVDRPVTAGEENGLEVVSWSIANREPAIRRTFLRYAVRGAKLGASAEQLARLGLRAAVVKEDDLAALLADLGGTTTSLGTWHGQVTAWREVARSPLDNGRVAMVGGRAEVLGGGWLRLMMRAWTVELEDGAVLSLQLAPQWIGEASDLSGLTNRDTLRGRVFKDAVISTELDRGTALIVMAAPAKVEEEEDPEGPPSAAPGSNGLGPPVDLPETPGEMLLTDHAASPPRRTVLVFRPRLPDILFAAPAGAAATETGQPKGTP